MSIGNIPEVPEEELYYGVYCPMVDEVVPKDIHEACEYCFKKWIPAEVRGDYSGVCGGYWLIECIYKKKGIENDN